MMSTLKHLGDVTSRNLEFSYRPDVPVSYGEETITESNLLELRRRHSDVVFIRTFSRSLESRIGSDWEWHVVGRKRTLKMRVQAKRVQSNYVLKIPYTIHRTGGQQRDVLIQTAHADRMRPMYCIYCTEPQRRLWTQSGRFQTGCLLVDARKLPQHTCRLNSIEWACWPWHFLFEAFPPSSWIDHHLDARRETELTGDLFPPPQPMDWDVPTILDLNENTGRQYDRTGVGDTTSLDLASVNADGRVDARRTAVSEYDDSRRVDGAQRMIAIDVRSLHS